MGHTTSLSRTERRKARTTTAILDAAEAVFVSHGYHGARVEEIAERADVAIGSLYTHFGSKLGCYLAVVDRALTLEESYLRPAIEEADGPGGALRAAGQAYLRFSLEHPGHFRLLGLPPVGLAAEGELSGPAERLARRGEELNDGLAGIIADGVAAGTLRPVDPRRTARFLWGAWTGVISLHERPDRLRLDDEELRAVLEEGDRIVTLGLLTDEARDAAEEGR